MVLYKSDGTEANQNKIHVDGNETTSEKQQLPFYLNLVMQFLGASAYLPNFSNESCDWITLIFIAVAILK